MRGIQKFRDFVRNNKFCNFRYIAEVVTLKSDSGLVSDYADVVDNIQKRKRRGSKYHIILFPFLGFNFLRLYNSMLQL